MTAQLRFLRRVSLLLLLVWLGVVAASFLRRQIDRRPPTGKVEIDDGSAAAGDQPVRVHKGFVYTDTVGVEPNFRVAADQTVEFASGWFELRDVELTLYHGGEVAYGLTAKRARLNREKREAIATGDVRLSLGGGIAVSAAGFSLKGEERRLESEGPATFAGPGMGGLAGGVVCRLADNSVDLIGGVSIAWREQGEDTPSVVLLTPRATYSRDLARIDFPQGATLLRGTLRVHGGAAAVQLGEAEGDPESVVIEEPVEVAGQLADGTALTARCGRMQVEWLDDGRLRLTADPAASLGWVELRMQDADLGWREVSAWRLVGEGTNDAWEWVEAQGLACITDFPPREEPRHLSGDRARLAFVGGRPTSAVAEGNIRIEAGEQWAEGGLLEFSLGGRTFNLRPSPAQRVSVGTGEVACVCDRLESGNGSTIVARGNVSGVLRRAALWGSATVPVRFAGESAVVAASGARLDLEGEARLWQGDRLVRADRITFERDSEKLNAAGKVVTLARLSPRGTSPGELVQLHARSMEYQHASGLAVYAGDVVFEDSQSTASCQRLTVTMDDSGQVVLATLDGGVTVTQRATSRVIKGQSARIDTIKDILEIVGTPVLVDEPGGDQVKANRLEWRRATGTLAVFGAEGSPTETIYHPPTPAPTPAAGSQPKRKP